MSGGSRDGCHRQGIQDEGSGMKIAIVGGGISGLGAAWLLSQDSHKEIVLFEREDRLGGHTHTHTVVLDGKKFQVDTGFIVYNNETYPLLKRLFHELGVA